MIHILKIVDKNFETLAYLNNINDITVREIINGEYTLNFKGNIEELKTEYLYDENNLLEIDNDYFRPVKLVDERLQDGISYIVCNAEHISYDLLNKHFPDFKYLNKDVNFVMLNALQDTGFTYLGSDITLKTDIQYEQETNAKAITIAIANDWKGELKYFQKQISILSKRGKDRGVQFRLGKNLKSVRRTIDRKERDEQGNPKILYEVDILDLREQEGYEDLEYFELGDTIKVIDEILGLEVKARIIEWEYNPLKRENTRVKLGNELQDIRGSLSGLNNKINKKIADINASTNKAIEKNKSELNQRINSSNQSFEEANRALDKAIQDLTNTTLDNFDDLDEKINTNIQNTNSAINNLDNKVDLTKNNLNQTLNNAIRDLDNSTLSNLSNLDSKINKNAQNTNNQINNLNNKINTNNNTVTEKINKQAQNIQNISQSLQQSQVDFTNLKQQTDDLGLKVTQELLSDIITSKRKVRNHTGTVTFDGNGILIHDQPTEETSSWAMRLNSTGFMIANSKYPNGNWNWRTYGTGHGFTADMIVAGVLRAINIQGVLITGSTVNGGTVNGVNINGSHINGGSIRIGTENRDYLEIGSGGISGHRIINGTDITNIQIEQREFSFDNQTLNGFLQFNDTRYSGTQQTVMGYVPNTKTFLIHGMWENSLDLMGFNNGVQIDAGNTGVVIGGRGGLRVVGNKNSLVFTKNYGGRLLYAYEMDKCYFATQGENKLEKGICKIELDPIFLETIETDNYHIQLTEIGKSSNIYVADIKEKYFIVKSDTTEEGRFFYTLSAIRKDYKNKYLEEVKDENINKLH